MNYKQHLVIIPNIINEAGLRALKAEKNLDNYPVFLESSLRIKNALRIAFRRRFRNFEMQIIYLLIYCIV